MKIVTHIDSDKNPVFMEGDAWIENWLDNRSESIVRTGGEEFQTHFEPEIGLGWEIFTVDPKRSFVIPLWHAMVARDVDLDSFQIADFLACFLVDVGFDLDASKMAQGVAFHTMIPRIVSSQLSKAWMHVATFNRTWTELTRVVNNPFFYADTHASSKRLLEIAQDDGCTYAVDMSAGIPTAEVLAHEIALVNHIQDGEDAVSAAETEIMRQIQGVL